MRGLRSCQAVVDLVVDLVGAHPVHFAWDEERLFTHIGQMMHGLVSCQIVLLALWESGSPAISQMFTTGVHKTSLTACVGCIDSQITCSFWHCCEPESCLGNVKQLWDGLLCRRYLSV